MKKQNHGALPFISPPEKYNPNTDDFHDWWPATENYLKIISATVQEDTQAAILLALFDNITLRKLTARSKETGDNLYDLSLEEVKTLVKTVFQVTPPVFADRFLTFTLRQDSSETLDDWAAKVMEQTHKFHFTDFTFDDLQTLVYALGLQNDSLRKELFKKMAASHKLTFVEAHKLCKSQLSFESACTIINQTIQKQKSTVYKLETQAEVGSEETDVEVNKIGTSNGHQEQRKKFSRSQPSKPCYFCGQLHFNSECPHRDKTCHKCNKIGHLGRVCKSSSFVRPHVNPVHAIATSLTSRRIYVQLLLNDFSTQLQLDTASDVSIISKGTWNAIGSPKMIPTVFAAKHAGAGQLVFLGESKIDVKLGEQQVLQWNFLVSPNPVLNILGLDLLDTFKLKEKSLASFCCQIATNVNSDYFTPSDSIRLSLSKAFPKAFSDGLGTCCMLKAQLQLK
jgi:hypothetical protein